MAVTAPTIPRARQILQAIANESDKRGWTMNLDPHDDRRFTITTPECSFDLALREELVNAEVPDADTLSAAKYPWQRVPMKIHKVGSGRLTLQLGQYYRARTWSDRTRWRLDDKLGALFVELDNRVAVAAEERRARDADLLRRQQAWDHAAHLAQQDYVGDLNRRRLIDQVTRLRQARDIREYADSLEDSVGSVGDIATATAIREWQQFARAEADRIDPAQHVDQLAYDGPVTVGPDDFTPFMPKGFNAHQRPTR